MKLTLCLLFVSGFLSSSVRAQDAGEVAVELINSYRKKDLEGVRKHLAPALAMSVDKKFFSEKEIRAEIAGLRKWDGKVREVRYFQGRTGLIAAAYYDEDHDPGKVRVLNLTRTGRAWKQSLGSFVVVEREKFRAYAPDEASVRAAPAIVQGDRPPAREGAPNKGYSLEMADGTSIRDCSLEQLRRAFASLGEENFFVTLNSPEGYVQASRAGGGYDLEYRDQRGQFSAADSFSAEAALELFSAYLMREKNWRSRGSWRQFD